MSYDSIEVRELTPGIGATISGVNLAEPLGNQTYQEVHDALMTHQVVFFHDQPMTLDQHLALGRSFGELHVHPGSPPPEGYPEVLVIHADANSTKISGEQWHSDVSCDEEPPMASILHLHTVPESGGDTIFASMYRAYDALSEPMKIFLGGLSATHDGEQVYRGRYAERGVDDTGKAYPRAVHPVIRTHPVTGRKALYVNTYFTSHINELAPEESRALLDYLCAHAIQPAFQCRFKWRPNTVAFWDNRVRPAYRDVGLLPASALRLSGDDQGRPAFLSLRVRLTSGHPAPRLRFVRVTV